VQGVGFRPFVYRVATALGLAGHVLNDSSGVLVEVEGPADQVAALQRVLLEDAPPLARVTAVDAERLSPAGLRGFRIVESHDAGTADAPVSVDTTTCPECLAEVDDPSDRRYGYAFTNCTNCGPRYTIVLGVPYDRPATTMAGFTMCSRCQAEYDDPADRRFHAQPNACPACGPQLSWRTTHEDPSDATLEASPLAAAVAAILDGCIVAMKGLGGYHLVADATNTAAVAELRRRKARDDKPFAIMVPSLDAAEALCDLDAPAIEALTSIRRPIVLAQRRAGTGVADAVAPGLPELGLMLPYTPLHHLLMRGAARPLVMTSGNLSDEPIAHDDVDANARLGPLVDGLLQHDRPIHIRSDDSVVRAQPHRVQVLRRSRGYAPEPMRLPFRSSHAVLGVGAELKSTISVARADWVVASHHIGDLEHLATYRSFLQAVEHLPRLYGVEPRLVVHDMHPEYLSTKWAIDWAAQRDVPLLAVQHHHAHVAACMIEHGRTAPVLGIAYDGLGYGADGSMWGGELLIADLATSRRVGHLRPVRMPGGTAAIREPWRMGAVWAAAAKGRDAAERGCDERGVDAVKAAAVLDLAEHRLSPVTTSAGRLFDAVATLLGGRQVVTYEAQAAIELEALARSVPRSRATRYEGCVAFDYCEPEGRWTIDPAPLIAAMLDDVDDGVGRHLISAGFHEAFGAATAEAAAAVAAAEHVATIALTGGVFQNSRLTEIVEDGLATMGFEVLVHAAVPPNDGGISVGQAAIGAFTAALS
jgi:hydrogenase maturation protein HypF